MDVQNLLPILLSWAVHLSGYPMPAEAPEISFVSHDFFVERVCGGRECTAVGWYDDRNIIYIDDKYRQAEDPFAHSLLVHEIVHYLQHQSGRFDSLSCDDSRAREHEAYNVQNAYILQAQGRFALIRPAPTACAYPQTTAAASGSPSGQAVSDQR